MRTMGRCTRILWLSNSAARLPARSVIRSPSPSTAPRTAHAPRRNLRTHKPPSVLPSGASHLTPAYIYPNPAGRQPAHLLACRASRHRYRVCCFANITIATTPACSSPTSPRGSSQRRLDNRASSPPLPPPKPAPPSRRHRKRSPLYSSHQAAYVIPRTRPPP